MKSDDACNKTLSNFYPLTNGYSRKMLNPPPPKLSSLLSPYATPTPLPLGLLCHAPPQKNKRARMPKRGMIPIDADKQGKETDGESHPFTKFFKKKTPKSGKAETLMVGRNGKKNCCSRSRKRCERGMRRRWEAGVWKRKKKTTLLM